LGKIVIWLVKIIQDGLFEVLAVIGAESILFNVLAVLERENFADFKEFWLRQFVALILIELGMKGLENTLTQIRIVRVEAVLSSDGLVVERFFDQRPGANFIIALG